MKIIRIFLVLSLFFVIVSCEKEEIVPLSGSWVGFVNLIDNKNVEMVDRSGITVSVEGTSRKGVTDESGWFEINGVSAGTYNLVYSGTDMGTRKLADRQFVGGTMPALATTCDVYQMPQLEIESLTLEPSSNVYYLHCYGQFVTPDGYVVASTILPDYKFVFYFSTSSDVSNVNYEDYTSYMCTGDIMSLDFFVYPTIANLEFEEGTTIYVGIYMINPYDWGYVDSETGVRPTEIQVWEPQQFIMPAI